MKLSHFVVGCLLVFSRTEILWGKTPIKLMEGSGSVLPTPINHGNGVIFIGWDSQSNAGIWKTDGTPGGTALIKGIKDWRYSEFIKVGNSVYFTDKVELWRTDGSMASNQLIATSFTDELYLFGSKDRHLYYLPKSYPGSQQELWQTDGTHKGTKLLAKFYHLVNFIPGKNLGFIFHVIKDQKWEKMALSVLDYCTQKVTFVTDLQDVISPASYFVANGEILNDQIVFYFENRSPRESRSGNGYTRSLWSSDGTKAGTNAIGFFDGYVYDFRWVGKKLLIRGVDKGQSGLWRTDGTELGTQQIAAGESPFFFLHHSGVSGSLYFEFWETDRFALWRTDGTILGTTKVASIRSTAQASFLRSPFYFKNCDKLFGCELWESDGTAAGTKLALDLEPGPNSSYADPIAHVGKKIIFTSQTGLWSY